MISVTRLYNGDTREMDVLRYGTRPAPEVRRPIVVWNSTRACNLRCWHCYAGCDGGRAANEMDTRDARRLITHLGEFKAPVLLFSGGEPLMRPDLLELMAHAKECGLRVVISTNGTLITPEIAGRFAQIGVSYVGVSLDGVEPTNDRFRGVAGAFGRAVAGMRACVAAGVRVGLRLTLTKHNFAEIGDIFDLLEANHIDRVCFYHLVYTGNAGGARELDVTHAQAREAMDRIIDRAADAHRRGLPLEVLTVDNHADGPYLYLRLQREDPARAAKALALLEQNGGNSSGIGISCIGWDGDVYPDQFWRQHTLGNVRQRPFGDIWLDTTHPLMGRLKDRRQFLKGRCARCRWLSMCNGNFRARAEAVHGDAWEQDPACYLTDSEIA